MSTDRTAENARRDALHDAANADITPEAYKELAASRGASFMLGWLEGRCHLRAAIEALPGYKRD